MMITYGFNVPHAKLFTSHFRVNWLRAKAHHCRWAEDELVNATTHARIAVVRTTTMKTESGWLTSRRSRTTCWTAEKNYFDFDPFTYALGHDAGIETTNDTNSAFEELEAASVATGADRTTVELYDSGCSRHMSSSNTSSRISSQSSRSPSAPADKHVFNAIGKGNIRITHPERRYRRQSRSRTYYPPRVIVARRLVDPARFPVVFSAVDECRSPASEGHHGGFSDCRRRWHGGKIAGAVAVFDRVVGSGLASTMTTSAWHDDKKSMLHSGEH